jgi:beta-lactamase regulating signal transducer with metallopeptidase domain
MNLYLDAGILSALVVLLVCPFTTWLARASWVSRSPRAAVALWHCVGISATLATIGAGLCVATVRFHAGFMGGVSELGEGILGGHPLQGLGLPDALGLTLAADVGVVLVSVVGVVVLRTVLARARHRRLLNLLAAPPQGRTGTLTLDHPSPVAYCLPGIRPRIVISSGTMRLLDQMQLAAVIEHERGHAHERHGLVMLPMTSLTEPFRWIPYARLAPRAVASLLEMAADDHAARRHAPPVLASALVAMSTFSAPPRCAFAVASQDVHTRVHRLLSGDRISKSVAMAAGLLCTVAVAAPLAVLFSS